MEGPPIVLASGSPRRRQLLEMLGIPVLVRPSAVQEIPLPREAPATYARRLARDKARAVPGEFVLGADTIVVGTTKLITPAATMNPKAIIVNMPNWAGGAGGETSTTTAHILLITSPLDRSHAAESGCCKTVSRLADGLQRTPPRLSVEAP